MSTIIVVIIFLLFDSSTLKQTASKLYKCQAILLTGNEELKRVTHLQSREYNQPIQSRSISQLITCNRWLKPIPDGFCTRQHFKLCLKIPTQFQHDICGVYVLSFFLSMETIFRFLYFFAVLVITQKNLLVQIHVVFKWHIWSTKKWLSEDTM